MVVIASGLVCSGCVNPEAAGDTDPWSTLADRPCPEDSTVDGLSFGVPFLLEWCNGCHSSALPEDERAGAPPDVSFDDIDAVHMHADRIWTRAADSNDTMPPAGGPTAEERALLGEWLACGAPLRVDP
jgi:hypothetical protein